MVEVELDIKKNVEQNAAFYYNESKKYKRKIDGLKKAIEDTEKLIKKEQDNDTSSFAVKKATRNKDWFEKFHYFFINEHLVIGGKDAKTNDILFKKYLEKDDLFFHTEVHGAAVVILKKGQELSDKELEKVAIFAGCFSNSWKSGKGTADIYCVKPEQVSISAKSGEYLAKGSFVIKGERKYFRNVELKLEIGFINDKLSIVPAGTITEKKIILKPDAVKSKGESAKLIYKKLKEVFPDREFDINWVQEILPNGGSRIS